MNEHDHSKDILLAGDSSGVQFCTEEEAIDYIRGGLPHIADDTRIVWSNGSPWTHNEEFKRYLIARAYESR